MRNRKSNCKGANVLKNILYKIGCSIGQAVYEKILKEHLPTGTGGNGDFKDQDTCW